MTRVIYLLPYGGLCNRINAITSVVNFSNENNFKLKIFWEKNSDLSADFTDLFEDLNLENVLIVKLRWYSFLYFRARKANLFLPKIFRLIIGFNQVQDWSSKLGNLNEVLRCGKNYLSTCHSIGDKKGIDKLFIPKSVFLSELIALQKKFSENTIGVHIRRGDHIRAIKASPIESFYSKMDQEIKTNENTKFYVATDSEKVKKDLKERYNGRIIMYDSPLTRTTYLGMSGAIIDLWALSSTKKIIGTPFSTFSIVASEIGGIDLNKEI